MKILPITNDRFCPGCGYSNWSPESKLGIILIIGIGDEKIEFDVIIKTCLDCGEDSIINMLP
jgi:ribosomal protein S27AE